MPNHEPWEIPADERESLKRMYTLGEDDILQLEIARRVKFEKLQETYREGLSQEEADNFFFEKYGFHHKCRCAEDVFAGDVVVVPICGFNLRSEALIALETVLIERQGLYDALDGAIEDKAKLREQIEALGETPCV